MNTLLAKNYMIALDALPNSTGVLDDDQFRAIAAHLLYLPQPSIKSEASTCSCTSSPAQHKPLGSTRAAGTSLIRCSPTESRNTPASTTSS